MEKGILITLEGTNAVGKSTQAALLKENLESKGLPVVQTRDPGGVRIAEEIRDYLIAISPGYLNPEKETELYYMARSALVNELIVPSLVAGKIVVLDRFEDSTYVHQGILRGVHFDKLRNLHKQYMNGVRPNLTFLLDLSYEKAKFRLEQQLSTNYDPADELNKLSYNSIRRAYWQIYSNDLASDRWRPIDASRSIHEVSSEILLYVNLFLALQEVG